MGRDNFRRRRCPPRTGAERPVGNGVVPVPSEGQSPARAHPWGGCSCHPGLPGSVGEEPEPQPRGPTQPRDEVSVRWGPPTAAPMPCGHLPGTESSGAPWFWERMGLHKQLAFPETGCLPWVSAHDVGPPSHAGAAQCQQQRRLLSRVFPGHAWHPRVGGSVPLTAPIPLLQDLLPCPGEPSATGDAAQRHALRRARPAPGELLRRQQAAAGPRSAGLGDHPPLQLQAVRGVSCCDGRSEGPCRRPRSVAGGSPAPQLSKGTASLRRCHSPAPADQLLMPGSHPSFSSRVLTCGRKLLGLWPATQDNSRARSSAPNFHQPDSVILQVQPCGGGSQETHTPRAPRADPAHPLPLPQIDFPTSAFEVKFTSPLAARFSPKYEFSSLGEEDQRKLREAMQKKSLYW